MEEGLISGSKRRRTCQDRISLSEVGDETPDRFHPCKAVRSEFQDRHRQRLPTEVLRSAHFSHLPGKQDRG